MEVIVFRDGSVFLWRRSCEEKAKAVYHLGMLAATPEESTLRAEHLAEWLDVKFTRRDE